MKQSVRLDLKSYVRMYDKFIFSAMKDFELFDKDQDGLITPKEWLDEFAIAMNIMGATNTSMFGTEMNDTTHMQSFAIIDKADDGYIELVSKELNHMAAILHVYVGV